MLLVVACQLSFLAQIKRLVGHLIFALADLDFSLFGFLLQILALLGHFSLQSLWRTKLFNWIAWITSFSMVYSRMGSLARFVTGSFYRILLNKGTIRAFWAPNVCWSGSRRKFLLARSILLIARVWLSRALKRCLVKQKLLLSYLHFRCTESWSAYLIWNETRFNILKRIIARHSLSRFL